VITRRCYKCGKTFQCTGKTFRYCRRGGYRCLCRDCWEKYKRQPEYEACFPKQKERRARRLSDGELERLRKELGIEMDEPLGIDWRLLDLLQRAP